jgi:phage-related protein
MATIIYWIGVVLAILAVVEIIKSGIGILWKIILSILILATSWIGLLVYYIFLRGKLEKIFK